MRIIDKVLTGLIFSLALTIGITATVLLMPFILCGEVENDS